MTIGPEWIIIIILAIWSVILTVLLVQLHFFNARIFKKADKGNVVQILDSLLLQTKDHGKALATLSQQYAKLEQDGKLHIQKVGLLRFNPFKDTGGDQSFILALLDAHDTGVVISSLHTRTGTRWYAKAVDNGKGLEYELSDEEQKALKEARHTG